MRYAVNASSIRTDLKFFGRWLVEAAPSGSSLCANDICRYAPPIVRLPFVLLSFDILPPELIIAR